MFRVVENEGAERRIFQAEAVGFTNNNDTMLPKTIIELHNRSTLETVAFSNFAVTDYNMKLFCAPLTSLIILPFLAVGLSSQLRLGDVAPSSSSIQNILKNTKGDKKYGYPTDLTQGIMPVS